MIPKAPHAPKEKASLLSAGAVVVRPHQYGFRYLLLRVHRYWDFPKGLVEPGEDPLRAAEREITEETSLRDLCFRWGLDYRETPPYGPHHKVARYYLAESAHGEVHLPVSPELGHPEHDEFRWVVSAAKTRALLHERVLPIFDWAVAMVEGAAAEL